MALIGVWGSFGVALGSHWGGFPLPIPSQSVGYQLAIMRIEGSSIAGVLHWGAIPDPDLAGERKNGGGGIRNYTDKTAFVRPGVRGWAQKRNNAYDHSPIRTKYKWQ